MPPGDETTYLLLFRFGNHSPAHSSYTLIDDFCQSRHDTLSLLAGQALPCQLFHELMRIEMVGQGRCGCMECVPAIVNAVRRPSRWHGP